MGARNYRDLIAWQKAMDLVDLVYQATKTFPKEEMYGLANQLRRAAVSIPSNIAEGQGRQTAPDFLRFLAIGHGSLREAETQVMIARRQGYLTAEQEEALLNLSAETGRLIKGLMNKLSGKPAGPTD
jgi:four helix bundle protein